MAVGIAEPLTRAQVETFHARGYLRLEQFTSPMLCRQLRAKVWEKLAKRGFLEDQPASWNDAYKEPFRLKPIRRSLKLDALNTEPLRQAAAQLLEGPIAREDRPLLLLTFPNTVTGQQSTGEGFYPQAWHTDWPRIPSVKTPGVGVLTYLADVEPGGGGTVILAGSHRIGNHPERTTRSKHLKRYLRRFEVCKQLFAKAVDPALDVRGLSEVVDGILLEVVELTGNTGDVVLFNGSILHSIAPNQNALPRLMVRGSFTSIELLNYYHISLEEQPSQTSPEATA